MIIDAAYYLEIYDAERIYSWTPKEFKNFIKGAQLRRIDQFEMSAVQAMWNAKAHHSKRLKLTELYDADKARQDLLDGGGPKKKKTLDLTLYRQALADMKAYRPQVTEKGG